MGQILNIDLNAFSTDSKAPRAKNKIKFIKEIVRCIQSESSFTKYMKRLTTKVVKHATVFINSLDRKSGVHPVISHRQILFEKKFMNIWNKIGKLAMTYNMTENNRTPMDQDTITIVNKIRRIR